MKSLKLVLVLISTLLISSFSILTYAADTTATSTSSTGTSVKKSADNAGQYVKDSAITADIKAKLLADSDVKSMHISVKTNHHVVTLTGYVETQDQKDKAAKIASASDGVSAVTNRLHVKPAKKSS